MKELNRFREFLNENLDEISLRGLMGRDMTGAEIAADPKKFEKVVDKIANEVFQIHKQKLRPDEFSAIEKLPGIGDPIIGIGSRSTGMGDLAKRWKKYYSGYVKRWLKDELEEFPDRDYSDPEEIKMAAKEVLYAIKNDFDE